MIDHIYRKYFWYLHLLCTAMVIYYIRFDTITNTLYESAKFEKRLKFLISSTFMILIFIDISYSMSRKTEMTIIEMIYVVELPFLFICTCQYLLFVHKDQNKIIDVIENLNLLDKLLMKFYKNDGKYMKYVMFCMHSITILIVTFLSAHCYFYIRKPSLKLICLQGILGNLAVGFILYCTVCTYFLTDKIKIFNEIITGFTRRDDVSMDDCQFCKEASGSYVLCYKHQMRLVHIHNNSEYVLGA